MTVTRRDVLKGAGAAGLAALAGSAPAAASRRPRRQPNIVLFYIDDLGYGDLSCYGSPLVRTPVLDGMARRGMRFTNFYSGAPTCTPSRAALLTGCYAPRVNLARVLFPGQPNGLAAQEHALPEYLKQAGYATAHFGKWHLGDPRANPAHHPMEHGFDRYFGIPYSNDMTPLPLYDDRTVIEEPPEQSQLTRRLTEQAVRFIGEHAEQPFFAYIAHPQPHEPLASEFAGRSAAGPHGDSVEEIDHYVGVVLDELDAQGVRENTCVIFTSDNGPWFVGSAGDLYGRKAETYEGGQRVPFIVEWPALVPARTVYERPAANVDVLPTLADAVGFELEPSRTVDGRSLWPALSRRHRVDRGDIFYYDDLPPAGRLNAVRRGRWKLHVGRVPGPYFTGRAFSATEELPQLFDLERDPEESYDLGAHHPEIVDELTARIEEFDAALRADHAARYPAG
jgi:arylsulfatase A-like enzyme